MDELKEKRGKREEGDKKEQKGTASNMIPSSKSTVHTYRRTEKALRRCLCYML